MKKVIGFVKFVRIVGSWTATVTSQFRKFCTVVTYQVHRLNYCIWTWGGEWALSLRILVFTYVRWVVALGVRKWLVSADLLGERDRARICSNAPLAPSLPRLGTNSGIANVLYYSRFLELAMNWSLRLREVFAWWIKIFQTYYINLL